MKNSTMKWTSLFSLLVCLSLTACSALTANARPANTSTSVPPAATATPAPSATPAPTETPQPTNTPLPTPTPTWVFNQPGHATVPILLYHHIADIEPANRYYVPPAVFQQQMLQLQAMGYTPIPISLLVKALTAGAELPARPVVITFDDGDADVYQNAFPVMRALGFPGTMFLVANRMNSDGFFSAQIANEMIAAGWEMGSHSFSHQNLKEDHSLLDVEVRHSKEVLDAVLTTPVTTFAYPFGEMDADVANAVYQSGFQSAVGLGGGYEHSMSTLYYLLRNEVTSDLDLNGFVALLPWK